MKSKTQSLERAAYCTKEYDSGNLHEWYEFSPMELHEYMESIVNDCIEELECNKEGDPYTGDLFISEKNSVIEYQIQCLKERFLGNSNAS